mgnify:CR=1 FL=1
MRPLTLAHLALGTTPRETIEAAAAAGFAAAGVRVCPRRPGDPYPGESLLGRPLAARELRARAADLGIRMSNVSAYQFYPDVGWDDVAPAVDTAGELGAPIIVANGFDPDLARFAALFSRYCAAAHEARIRVALEFLPYSAVRTLDAALSIVMQSEAPNAGVLLDALHLDRSGASPADIARIPDSRITFAQLCDARKWTGPRTDALLLAEARTARLPSVSTTESSAVKSTVSCSPARNSKKSGRAWIVAGALPRPQSRKLIPIVVVRISKCSTSVIRMVSKIS